MRATGGALAVTVLSRRLPEGVHGAAAASDGSVIWVFGGLTSSGVFLDTIRRFDPATETLEPTAFRLPSGRQVDRAVFVGGKIYVFGGFDYTHLAQVLRYTPSTDTLYRPSTGELRELSLPIDPHQGDATATVGSRAWLFGGIDPVTQVFKSSIVRFELR